MGDWVDEIMKLPDRQSDPWGKSVDWLTRSFYFVAASAAIVLISAFFTGDENARTGVPLFFAALVIVPGMVCFLIGIVYYGIFLWRWLSSAEGRVGGSQTQQDVLTTRRFLLVVLVIAIVLAYIFRTQPLAVAGILAILIVVCAVAQRHLRR